jgi:hypothetical protein
MVHRIGLVDLFSYHFSIQSHVSINISMVSGGDGSCRWGEGGGMF